MTRSQLERAAQRQTLQLGMESGSLTGQELMEAFNWKPGTNIASESRILTADKPAFLNW